MGFHTCAWCSQTVPWRTKALFGPHSSQTVTLTFANGHCYQFPHVGLLHYVTEHHYLPPDMFIQDVMNVELASSRSVQAKGLLPEPQRIGFLTYPDLPTGQVPADFVNMLHGCIVLATFRGPFNTVTTYRSIQ